MKLFRLLTVVLLLAVCGRMARAESGQLVGHGNDANRGTPVHRIEIYDDQGMRIRSYDQNPQPFSTRITCGRCHEYGTIASGWHFNAHDAEVDPGRPGQPWVLTDSETRTQIPLAGRAWPGTFTPQALGISPWEFLEKNFSHFPGGSYGEIAAEQPYEAIRQEICGLYEINCLACHNADPQQDQDMAALQAARQNYRWIPAASSHMGVVSGNTLDLTVFFDPAVDTDKGPSIRYKKDLFDSEDMVSFNITGKPANERCYFCHSNQNLGVNEEHHWSQDEDVHLSSGLKCIDCHRNGDDHMITRGIETEGPGKTLTCEGCHLGEDETTPAGGRLGAPHPAHAGIPTIHFEKLACTACHSGTWPADEVGRWKTARIHKTGLHGTHSLNLKQPHVYAPVMMTGADGKIAPHKVFWPAYWATLDGETVTPLAPEAVKDAAGSILEEHVEKVDDWRPLTEAQIAGVLTQLSTDETKAVYITGGKLYQLNGETLTHADHDAAQPYAWPMAHDVRPAEQSMGVRLCKDCHTTDSPFFFGKAEIDTPVKTEAGAEFVEMIQLQGIDRLYMWAFNASFVFRPMLKIIAILSCCLIGLVVLTYVLKAVGVITTACSQGGDHV